ncbi:hypothetical protein [Amycolatopsis suaedae]|uniref:Uncharacterized protein n=1 Tax=Amycolatopsis suaedae TaxID=2510978 RepID=A0A4Q7J129_9PSEU|nr:hypothetical protein [Amycolatopsis suaedae]RZQ60527.1 hypothetical protein EWH70_28000 [Amycolatopsis suaedae]
MEQTNEQHHVWGSPPPADRPRWSVRRTVATIAVAVVAAAGGAVAVWAASAAGPVTSPGPGPVVMGPGPNGAAYCAPPDGQAPRSGR